MTATPSFQSGSHGPPGPILMELETLRKDLQEHQSSTVQKAQEMALLQQRLQQTQRELTSAKMLAEELQSKLQINGTSAETHRYKRLEEQVTQIVAHCDARELALRSNLRKQHDALELELSRTKEELRSVTASKNTQLAQFAQEMDSLLEELAAMEEERQRKQHSVAVSFNKHSGTRSSQRLSSGVADRFVDRADERKQAWPSMDLNDDGALYTGQDETKPRVQESGSYLRSAAESTEFLFGTH